MPEQTKKQIGNLGEDLAKKFLQKRKYKILDKNYYVKGGEIDLIVKDKTSGELVFVEVKTRSSNLGGWPEQAVNLVKKQRMSKTAEKYLRKNKYLLWQNYRFDIISVELDNLSRKAKIMHFKYI
ncbi:MAG: YraN family protein [Patescibacteria group bacterium]